MHVCISWDVCAVNRSSNASTSPPALEYYRWPNTIIGIETKTNSRKTHQRNNASPQQEDPNLSQRQSPPAPSTGVTSSAASTFIASNDPSAPIKVPSSVPRLWSEHLHPNLQAYSIDGLFPNQQIAREHPLQSLGYTRMGINTGYNDRTMSWVDLRSSSMLSCAKECSSVL